MSIQMRICEVLMGKIENKIGLKSQINMDQNRRKFE